MPTGRRCCPWSASCAATWPGSAWKEYREQGTVHAMSVAPGLVEAERLAEPLFTPSTKAAVGDHDENISLRRGGRRCSVATSPNSSATVSLAMFGRASRARRGSWLSCWPTRSSSSVSPTIGGRRELVVADEVLTPDSSRFWRAAEWSPGATPIGFDKQPVRDLPGRTRLGQHSTTPRAARGGRAATSERYRYAYERITGLSSGRLAGRVRAVARSHRGGVRQ